MSVFLTLFRLVGGWLLLAVVTGLISGFSNASLLAMINHSLSLSGTQAWLNAGLHFALLALLMLTTRIISQTTFMSLGQKVKARLRNELIQRISKTLAEDGKDWHGSHPVGVYSGSGHAGGVLCQPAKPVYLRGDDRRLPDLPRYAVDDGFRPGAGGDYPW
jgi:ABC-type multidrug transport system fused ATPase/permease subunit